MRHTIEELVAIAYRYYPKDLWDENPAYWESEEQQRKRLAIDSSTKTADAWATSLERLAARLPECEVVDRSHIVFKNSIDTCYYGRLLLPPTGDRVQHIVVALVSILVPYYFIFRKITLPDATPVAPIQYLSTPNEDSYARAFAAEIENAFPDYEYMPPEVGLTVVPRVVAHNRSFGEATLYDCLFTDFRW